MPDTTVYATRAELRKRIDYSGSGPSFNETEDAIQDAALEAWSRAVDGYCNDLFGQVTATKVFSAGWADRLVVPSLVSISASGLKTDDYGTATYSRTWATTDYVLWPSNAALETPARPYREIRIDRRTTSGGYTFPLGQLGVQVAGVWGWPAIPQIVVDVVLLETQRWLQQMEAPSGVVASAELGDVWIKPELNPTSKFLLSHVVRMGSAVALNVGVAA